MTTLIGMLAGLEASSCINCIFGGALDANKEDSKKGHDIIAPYFSFSRVRSVTTGGTCIAEG